MTQTMVPQRRRAAQHNPFSGRVVLLTVLIGVLAFVAFLLLLAFSDQLRSGDDAQEHALSKSAVGFNGAVEFYRALGWTVEINRDLEPILDNDALLILTPQPFESRSRLGIDRKPPEPVPETDSDADTDPAEVDEAPLNNQRLLRYDPQQLRLVVLPKWLAFPDPNRRGWVRAARDLNGEFSIQPIRKKDVSYSVEVRSGETRPTLSWADGRPIGRTGPLRQYRTLKGSSLTPVVVDENGGMVIAREGQTLFLADADLLNTHGLANVDTARVMTTVVQELSPRPAALVFDVTLHGLKNDKNMLRLAFQPPFLGVTLALALMAALIALQAVNRFGPPKGAGRAFALGKEALADNSAALIRLARREHSMAERYALFVRGAAAKAVGAPHDLSDTDLEDLLDRLSERAGVPAFSTLRQEAARAHDVRTALAAARRLYSWRLEMTRERR